MDTTEQLVKRTLTWDTLAIIQGQADELRSEDSSLSENKAFSLASEDSDIIQFAWDDIIDCLQEIMNDFNPQGHWHIEGRNMGWQNRSGTKDFYCDDAKDFIKSIFPDTSEFSFTLTVEADHLFIRISHHDAPTGESRLCYIGSENLEIFE